jgi:hypothetical protein
MNRKHFLKTAITGAVGLRAVSGSWLSSAASAAEVAAEPAHDKPQSRFLTEPARQTPVIAQADVVVLGGGAAGMVAAMASARNGARTLLIEQQSVFGGTILGGASVLNDFYNGFRQHSGVKRLLLVRGTPLELVKYMVRAGACPGFDGVEVDSPEAPSTILMLPEPFKKASPQMMQEFGVDLAMRTYFCDALAENGRIRGVAVQNKSGRGIILGKQFIDCSGDADLSASAGAECLTGKELNPPRDTTLLFSLNNVDVERIVQTGKERGYLPTVTVLKSSQPFGAVTIMDINLHSIPGIAETAKKMHSVRMLHLIAAGNSELYYVNTTRVIPKNILDWREARAVESENRQQIDILLELIKKHMPGFENAYVSQTASYFGVRRSRVVRCEYAMKLDDITGERSFPDQIGLFGYQDLPSEATHPARGGAYGLPFRAMRPTKVANLLVAGKLITPDWQAHMSTRNTACCMLQGDAVGTAAALCAAQGVDPAQLEVKMLQDTLRKNGAYLPAA